MKVKNFSFLHFFVLIVWSLTTAVYHNFIWPNKINLKIYYLSSKKLLNMIVFIKRSL